MRIYGGVTYKGRPYAGVGTSMRIGGRGGQRGPCKYRVVRCGECAWCRGRRKSWRRTDGKTNPMWMVWTILIGAGVVCALPFVIFAAQLLAWLVR